MQLRDAQTSELIAEGSPEEIALIAAGLDPGDILFDDVGSVDRDGRSLFDPATVAQASEAELAGLERAIADPVGNNKAELRAIIKHRREQADAARAARPAARAAMKAARDRVRTRSGR